MRHVLMHFASAHPILLPLYACGIIYAFLFIRVAHVCTYMRDQCTYRRVSPAHPVLTSTSKICGSATSTESRSLREVQVYSCIDCQNVVHSRHVQELLRALYTDMIITWIVRACHAHHHVILIPVTFACNWACSCRQHLLRCCIQHPLLSRLAACRFQNKRAKEGLSK